MPTIDNGKARVIDLPDGKKNMEVDLELRDLKWGDGTPVTAKDVAFTLEVGRHPLSGVASSEFFRCSSGIRPFFASSASRRSVIEISVGHFMSTPPSSDGNVCVGNPATVPPDSTPRMRVHQPYVENALLMLVAIA